MSTDETRTRSYWDEKKKDWDIKLESLAALCRALLHPELIRKKLDEKNFAWKKKWKKICGFFSENESCLTNDIAEWQVQSLLAAARRQ